MKISEMPNELIAERIPRGRVWLANNAQQIGTELAIDGTTYDDEKFQRNLKVYEELCEEYRRRGLDDAPIQTDDALIENEKKT